MEFGHFSQLIGVLSWLEATQKEVHIGMPSIETIAVNTKRKLWANCAGYCENPGCNKYLFKEVDDETVSIANMAHIIGAGTYSDPTSGKACSETLTCY